MPQAPKFNYAGIFNTIVFQINLGKMKIDTQLYCFFLIVTISLPLQHCFLFFFLMWIWITVWCGFLSAWRTSFNMSCKANLLSMNSLYQGMSLFCYIFASLLDIGFLFLFFSFKNWIYHPSASAEGKIIFFWWKVSYWSYWGSLIHDKSFFLFMLPCFSLLLSIF